MTLCRICVKSLRAKNQLGSSSRWNKTIISEVAQTRSSAAADGPRDALCQSTFFSTVEVTTDSVAEWLACWT